MIGYQMAQHDDSIFSVMATTRMGYLQAVRHLNQRRTLGYNTDSTVIGRKVQKRGGIVGSPTFQNGELEETVVGFVFSWEDDLKYVFENGSTIRCNDCTLL